jgi:hypothetical protein
MIELLGSLAGPLLQPFAASIGAAVAGRFALSSLAPQALAAKILAVLLCAALCAYGGWRLAQAFAAQEKIEALNLAAAERERGVRLVVQADRKVVRQLNAQRAKSDELQNRLTVALNGMARCAVPPSVAGVFNESSSPVGPGTDGKPEPARPPAKELGAVDAGEIIAVCQWNYTNVCIPNAIQLDALRAFYNDLRSGRKVP